MDRVLRIRSHTIHEITLSYIKEHEIRVFGQSGANETSARLIHQLTLLFIRDADKVDSGTELIQAVRGISFDNRTDCWMKGLHLSRRQVRHC